MSGYAFHPDAFDDLEEIWEYIAQDNIDAADLTARPLRFHVARVEYLVAYAPDEKPLWVLAVFHGRRNPRLMAALLRDRE